MRVIVRTKGDVHNINIDDIDEHYPLGETFGRITMKNKDTMIVTFEEYQLIVNSIDKLKSLR